MSCNCSNSISIDFKPPVLFFYVHVSDLFNLFVFGLPRIMVKADEEVLFTKWDLLRSVKPESEANAEVCIKSKTLLFH